MNTRVVMSDSSLATGESLIRQNLARRINQHGELSFISTHEICGVLDEEVREFKDTVHDNQAFEAAEELADIAVACIWGIASLIEMGKE